jgi:hypothetical protein
VSHLDAEGIARELGPDRIQRLRALPNLAVGALAGRDSIAAIVAAVRADALSTVLPTSVATGTEYGDTSTLLAGVTTLRTLLADECEVLDPLRIGSPALWAALNGRFAAEIADRWGVSSPCLACHLYVHLARVPLAWALGGVPIITGERDSHDGRVKLSQTSGSIDAETSVLAHAGVRLLTPIRVASGAQIGALVPEWPEGAKQLLCVHSGNYTRLDGTVAFDPDGYNRYLHEYFEPAGRAVVDAWRAAGLESAWTSDSTAAAAGALDYEAIVRDVLVTVSLRSEGSVPVA